MAENNGVNFYRWEGARVDLEPDPDAWWDWFRGANLRVAHDRLIHLRSGRVLEVSTMFLGVAQALAGEPLALFETVVGGDGAAGPPCRRTAATEAEARENHRNILELARAMRTILDHLDARW